MQPLAIVSAAGQVAAHLRFEIERGMLSDMMPGVDTLATELGVNHKTVEAALRQLQCEGLLVGQGAGKKRRIVLPEGGAKPRPLRVALLLTEPQDRHIEYMVELQHALIEAGHTSFFPGKSLAELGMNVEKIRTFVSQIAADAWVVMAGSREVLEWFSVQDVPAFALFGFRNGIAMAGTAPDKPRALADATRYLADLGHQRIVLLARRIGGAMELRLSEKAFLSVLEDRGIKTGDFNLPSWGETPEGLQQILTSLFRITPPTALIVDETPIYAATQQFLAGRGIRVPQQVSLVCTDPDPNFAWCMPTIAHIRWDTAPVVRRIVRWAANLSQGKPDIRQNMIPAEFVTGGTIGPPAFSAEPESR